MEDKMVGWHLRLDGYGFEQALGVGDEQGSLACCSPWESQRVRQDWATKLNWTDLAERKPGSPLKMLPDPFHLPGQRADYTTLQFLFQASSLHGLADREFIQRAEFWGVPLLMPCRSLEVSSLAFPWQSPVKVAEGIWELWTTCYMDPHEVSSKGATAAAQDHRISIENGPKCGPLTAKPGLW